MDRHTPRQSRFDSRGGAGRQPRVRRVRAVVLTACAAVLAVALAAGIYSSAEARSTARDAGESRDAVGGAVCLATPSATPLPRRRPRPLRRPAPRRRRRPSTRRSTRQLDAIIAANSQYQIGVALVDLSQGAGPAEAHEYGIQEKFVAASTAKVLAAEAYYHLVETGPASLDAPLGNYTAGFQLREMIQQSDNDSWSLIMDAVGHEELTEYAATLGVSYDPETNTLTPAEMATIVSRLYSGSLLNPADTAQLLSYMQDTNYETLIPAAVPDGITVFHKYGLLDDELHDAAVLARGGTAYALVIYTKGQDLSDVPERTEVIHQLTQAVTGALF